MLYWAHSNKSSIERSNWKMDERDVTCGELLCKEVKDEDDFIRFLRFCSDRLNKDEPVQAIWSAYQAIRTQK